MTLDSYSEDRISYHYWLICYIFLNHKFTAFASFTSKVDANDDVLDLVLNCSASPRCKTPCQEVYLAAVRFEYTCLLGMSSALESTHPSS
jgi:hypothetical protein